MSAGHGWVRPLPGGAKTRCGGPALCPECSKEAMSAALSLGEELGLLRPEVPAPVRVGTGPRGASFDSIQRLDAELKRARSKFPGNRLLLAALMEEVGELARAYLQRQGPAMVAAEAIQVACVAIRILEEGDSTFDDVTAEEAKP